jgi:formylglycine-generating enzyme required for sulfatase activity
VLSGGSSRDGSDVAGEPSQQAPEVPLAASVTVGSLAMELRLIPGGVFTMGDGDDAHQVRLGQPYYLGIHEVTQRQYERVMGANPSNFDGPDNPVEDVSWHDAVEFCRRLTAMPEEKAASHLYRLPTEAEWENACRAGSSDQYSFGDNDLILIDYAWFKGRSAETTHPVGQKKPNALGLFDMHGNVIEWCQDWYGGYVKDWYDDHVSGPVPNPTGPATGVYRVERGGGWNNYGGYCRSAQRDWSTPDYTSNDLGFRVLRVASRVRDQSAGASTSPTDESERFRWN